METNKYLFGASGHAKVVLDVLFSTRHPKTKLDLGATGSC